MNTVCDDIYRKTGGFLKGICHPDENYTMITDAGISWIRRDVPFPFKATGTINKEYLRFLRETKKYTDQGLRSVLISPYPSAFLEHGIDPRTPEGLKTVEAVCEFMARGYSQHGVCWQATNELFVVHFRMPLNEEESKNFLIASLKGLRRGDPDAVIGHNSVDPNGSWDAHCVEIDAVCDCDYIGFDCYNGTWFSGGTDTYIDRINELYALVKKPVILQEFGFASLGTNAHADFREAYEYFANLGFKSQQDVADRMDEFIELLPPALKYTALNCCEEDRYPAIISMMPHLLKMWFAEEVFPHTEEGQAAFYNELLPKLLANPYLAGAFLYCWTDSPSCFTCGASDCPCETAWGITRLDGTPKKAYDVIKNIFNQK
ncbi:MAG: hypothetical protein E7487_07830 [Ruminococcaceae bacterium]|nr:hypothetical protein [Oscillospiraceae bacterium]